jgi:RimJ/RimL family protein N-acetyltransferase
VSTIRAYRPSDQTSLLKVIDTVCAEGLMKTTQFQPTLEWEHALHQVDCRQHLLLVVEDAYRLVGWCRLFADDEVRPVRVELGIGLLTSHRRRGLGTELIRLSQIWAKQTGYSLMVLQVHPENVVARHVFEKSGFQYEDAVAEQRTMTQRLCAEEHRP